MPKIELDKARRALTNALIDAFPTNEKFDRVVREAFSQHTLSKEVPPRSTNLYDRVDTFVVWLASTEQPSIVKFLRSARLENNQNTLLNNFLKAHLPQYLDRKEIDDIIKPLLNIEIEQLRYHARVVTPGDWPDTPDDVNLRELVEMLAEIPLPNHELHPALKLLVRAAYLIDGSPKDDLLICCRMLSERRQWESSVLTKYSTSIKADWQPGKVRVVRCFDESDRSFLETLSCFKPMQDKADCRDAMQSQAYLETADLKLVFLTEKYVDTSQASDHYHSGQCEFLPVRISSTLTDQSIIEAGLPFYVKWIISSADNKTAQEQVDACINRLYLRHLPRFRLAISAHVEERELALQIARRVNSQRELYNLITITEAPRLDIIEADGWLVLLSADYLADDDDCQEFTQILERQRAKGGLLLPVIAHALDISCLPLNGVMPLLAGEPVEPCGDERARDAKLRSVAIQSLKAIENYRLDAQGKPSGLPPAPTVTATPGFPPEVFILSPSSERHGSVGRQQYTSVYDRLRTHLKLLDRQGVIRLMPPGALDRPGSDALVIMLCDKEPLAPAQVEWIQSASKTVRTWPVRLSPDARPLAFAQSYYPWPHPDASISEFFGSDIERACAEVSLNVAHYAFTRSAGYHANKEIPKISILHSCDSFVIANSVKTQLGVASHIIVVIAAELGCSLADWIHRSDILLVIDSPGLRSSEFWKRELLQLLAEAQKDKKLILVFRDGLSDSTLAALSGIEIIRSGDSKDSALLDDRSFEITEKIVFAAQVMTAVSGRRSEGKLE